MSKQSPKTMKQKEIMKPKEMTKAMKSTGSIMASTKSPKGKKK